MMEEARKTIYLVRRFRHCNCAANISSTSTIHNTIIHNEVTNDAERVVQCTLGLVNNLEEK
jgi:hypothetical protein